MTGWPKARLSDVCSINPRPAATLDPSEQVSFVAMADVDALSGSNLGEQRRSFSEVSTGYTPFQDGDLLVAKITPCFQNGKIAQVNIESGIGFGSTEFHVLRPNASELDTRYLLHLLRQEKVRVAGVRTMTGSGGQRRVPTRFISELQIPLPPVEEQVRISRILDRVDELRAQRRKAIALLDELSHSMFSNMFLEANARRWDWRRFGDVVDEFRYGTSIKSAANGQPTLRIPNVLDGRINVEGLKSVPVKPADLERLRLQGGDVLFVRTNGNPDFVGRCAVFSTQEIQQLGFDPRSFIFASYLIRARVKTDELDPVFLCAFMQSGEGRRSLRAESKTSAGQYNINSRGIGEVRVPVPPLQLQHEFADGMAALGQIREVQSASRSALDALFASLQFRAFRGEL